MLALVNTASGFREEYPSPAHKPSALTLMMCRRGTDLQGAASVPSMGLLLATDGFWCLVAPLAVSHSVASGRTENAIPSTLKQRGLAAKAQGRFNLQAPSGLTAGIFSMSGGRTCEKPQMIIETNVKEMSHGKKLGSVPSSAYEPLHSSIRATQERPHKLWNENK